jgi:phosphatidylglycerol---prolipoprotein diacylglyceryl transferase
MHIVININPVLFSLGPLSVRWYGLMYVVGIAIGLLVAWKYAKSKGILTDQLEKIVMWAIPAGFVGARLYYVLQQPLGQYLTLPWRIFAVWEGGMAFYGAIFAVIITIIVLAWRMRVSIWPFLDLAVIFGAVGQFFGRIGNIINGDIIGYPTNLPWGFVYTNLNSFPPSHTTAYQPAAFYEAIIDIILFSVLWWLRNRVKPGILFFTYILGYSLSQLIVFIWRNNEILLLGLKQAQITAIAVMILSAFAFWVFSRYHIHHQITRDG